MKYKLYWNNKLLYCYGKQITDFKFCTSSLTMKIAIVNLKQFLIYKSKLINSNSKDIIKYLSIKVKEND